MHLLYTYLIADGSIVHNFMTPSFGAITRVFVVHPLCFNANKTPAFRQMPRCQRRIVPIQRRRITQKNKAPCPNERY